MILQLFIAGLILGLIFFLSLEGFYSAVLMAVCSIFSLALAFNYAEPLGGSLASTLPELGDAVALGAAFIIPLVAMRLLADKFLPGMVHFPYWVDRIGGAAVGAVSASIMIGVLALCLRMLPFGASLLGYQPFAADAGPVPSPQVKPFWFRPDNFAVGLVRLLSGGSMSGGRSFAQVHPDYRRELAGFTFVDPATRRTSSAEGLVPLKVPTPEGEKQFLATATWIRYRQLDEAPPDLPKPEAGQDSEDPLRFRIGGQTCRLLRVSVQPSPMPDEEKYWLNGGQAQLTAYRVDDQGKRVASAPTVMLFPGWVADDLKRLTKVEPLGVGRAWQYKPEKSAAPAPVLGLIFAVPENCRPWFLTVRRHTRAELHMLGEGQRVQPSFRSTDPYAGFIVSGNWAARRWRKSLSARMPVVLSANGSANGTARTGVGEATVELVGDKLASARLLGAKQDFESTSGGRRIEDFAARDGCRIVQLEGEVGGNMGELFWTRLIQGVVRSGEQEIPLAGIALRTQGEHWLLFYDSRSAIGRFQGADVQRLTRTGGAVRTIHLILVVPEEAKDLVVDIGGGSMIQVELE